MSYTTLENLLMNDWLPDGVSPEYLFEQGDTWYLGLAGELACEAMCEKLLLPMLSRDSFKWEVELEKALVEAASLRPQHTVKNFKEAWWHFTTQSNDVDCVWFGSEDVVKELNSQVKFKNNDYLNDLHYDVDRRGFSLNMRSGLTGVAFSPKTIVMVPKYDFGVLAKNEKFFNFFFQPNKIFRYHLKDVEIGDDA